MKFVMALIMLAALGQHSAVHTMLSSGATVPAAVNAAPSDTPFASQLVGSTSAADVVTVSNPGSTPVTITSIVTTGDFAHTTTCGSTLPPASTCTVSVTFSPTTSGTLTGQTTITSNAKGSPQKIHHHGTGQTPPPPTTIFSSDFESGAIVPPWGFASTNTALNTNPSFSHGGNNSGQFNYPLIPSGTAEGNIAVFQGASHPHIFMRGWVYLKSPNGGPDTAIVQRKLMWIAQGTSASDGTGPFSVILDSFTGLAGIPSYPKTYLSIIGQGSACYGSQVALWEPGNFPIPFNTYVALEIELQTNTPSATGPYDGVVRIWVNGTLAMSSTTFKVNGNCTTSGFNYYSVGRQAGSPANETRYWDDIIVSTTGPIGP